MAWYFIVLLTLAVDAIAAIIAKRYLRKKAIETRDSYYEALNEVIMNSDNTISEGIEEGMELSRMVNSAEAAGVYTVLHDITQRLRKEYKDGDN